MTLSEIDPIAALIVVDLQKGIRAFPTTHSLADIAGNAGRLASAFRQRGLPVVLVSAAGRAPGRTERSRAMSASGAAPAVPSGTALEPLPELGAAPTDILVVKRTWGAFTGTGLDEQLRERGVTQVVIVGVATTMGVESTARQAHELGYHVTVATDAMSDASRDAHDGSILRIFPAIGETGSTDKVLALLAAR